MKDDLSTFNQRLDLINSKIDRLENKLDIFIKSINNQNNNSIPEMSIFNIQPLTSKLEEPTPLQSHNSFKNTLTEKENEILQLKQTNSDLSNQLTSMNNEQQLLMH